MHTFTVISNLMLHHLLPLEQEYSFIQNIPREELEHSMGNMDGTLDHYWNIIVVSNVMYHLPIPFDIFAQ